MSNKGDKEEISAVFSWQVMVMSDVKTIRYQMLAVDQWTISDIRHQILAAGQVTFSDGQVTISVVRHQILAAGQVTTERPEEMLVVLAPYR